MDQPVRQRLLQRVPRGFSSIQRRAGAGQRPAAGAGARRRGGHRGQLAGGGRRAVLSQLNSLDQNIFSLQDNLSFGTGPHRVTVGTANEFYSFDNAFFQARIGVWAFNSLDSLAAAQPAAFQRVLPTAARPEGPDRQLQGAAARPVRAGRMVAHRPPHADRRPPDGRAVQRQAGAESRARRPTRSCRSTRPNFPSGNMLWSPRLGFNFDPRGDGRTIVRGGVGYFTGRPPYVWLSNAFVNTGLEQVQLTCWTGTDRTRVHRRIRPRSRPPALAARARRRRVPSPNYFVDGFQVPADLPHLAWRRSPAARRVRGARWISSTRRT